MRVRVEARRKPAQQFPAQRGEFFQRMALDFLERFRLIEEKHDFFGAKRFDGDMWPNDVAKPSQNSAGAFAAGVRG